MTDNGKDKKPDDTGKPDKDDGPDAEPHGGTPGGDGPTPPVDPDK